MKEGAKFVKIHVLHASLTYHKQNLKSNYPTILSLSVQSELMSCVIKLVMYQTTCYCNTFLKNRGTSKKLNNIISSHKHDIHSKNITINVWSFVFVWNIVVTFTLTSPNLIISKFCCSMAAFIG